MTQIKLDWSSVFSGVQAVCAVVVTGIAVWGVFFTNLPETLIRQLRTDVSTAQEELIDLRRQQRAVELQYDASLARLEEMTRELVASEKAINERQSYIDKLRSRSAGLEKELRAVQEARTTYFRQIYASVLTGMFSSVRSEIEEARHKAARAAQYADFYEWIADGERLLKLFAEEEQAARARETSYEQRQRERDRNARWQAWIQDVPPSWSGIELSTSVAGWFVRHFSGDRTSRPESEYRAEDLAVAKRESMRLVEQVKAQRVPPDSGRSLLQGALKRKPVNLLLPADREELRIKVAEFLVKNSPAVDRPVRIHFPDGASSALVVHQGETVLSRLEDFESIINRLEQYLFHDEARKEQGHP